MTQHVLVEKAEKLLILTLNRPDKKNALTRAMYQTLATEITNADTDPDIRCVLIKANGDMFTAGNDLADFAAVGNSSEAPRPEDANPLLPALAKARTPLVAAVNGRAVGVGVTMLLHCDMVFLAEDAPLIAPFVNLALAPEAASSLLMLLRIGHARAFEMFVLGEPVSAQKAVNWGIANRSLPPADLHAAARATALAIAARAPAVGRCDQGADARRSGVAGAHEPGIRALPQPAQVCRVQGGLQGILGAARAGLQQVFG